jgi:hypothetical protein
LYQLPLLQSLEEVVHNKKPVLEATE